MNAGVRLSRAFPYMDLDLSRADMKVAPNRYLAMCLTATLFLFVFLSVILFIFFLKFGGPYRAFIIAFIVAAIVFIFQLNYPKVAASKRVRKLDADLLAALRALMIQLNSGVPLFDAMVIISRQEFGEVSKEFRETVKRINTGYPQIEALETMALRNPSPYFRRAIWQVANAMKEGAAIKKIVVNIISNLHAEQIIQIEKYGAQLNPLAMFYMMGAVILPVLVIVFVIILTSFLNLEEALSKLIFLSVLGFVLFFQFMFSGIVKQKRPSLLGD